MASLYAKFASLRLVIIAGLVGIVGPSSTRQQGFVRCIKDCRFCVPSCNAIHTRFCHVRHLPFQSF